MTTCFDWIFHRDITSEGWRDDTGLTLKEMREFMKDSDTASSVIQALRRDLGVAVHIEECDNLYMPYGRDYKIKTSTGDILYQGDEAAIVLMSVMENGCVPPAYLKDYRRLLGFSS